MNDLPQDRIKISFETLIQRAEAAERQRDALLAAAEAALPELYTMRTSIEKNKDKYPHCFGSLVALMDKKIAQLQAAIAAAKATAPAPPEEER